MTFPLPAAREALERISVLAREQHPERFDDAAREVFSLARGALARLDEVERSLQSIIVRCEEGDPRTNWLPTISRIATELVGRGQPVSLHVGQHVRALSGWEGYVAEISDEEACGQGRLVTCSPITLPGVPADGRPWKPITVTEDELTPTGKPDLVPARL